MLAVFLVGWFHNIDIFLRSWSKHILHIFLLLCFQFHTFVCVPLSVFSSVFFFSLSDIHIFMSTFCLIMNIKKNTCYDQLRNYTYGFKHYIGFFFPIRSKGNYKLKPNYYDKTIKKKKMNYYN